MSAFHICQLLELSYPFFYAVKNKIYFTVFVFMTGTNLSVVPLQNH